MDEQATIVVGVDGSDCARAALEFAVDEAVRQGAKLRVVWAFPPPEYWATAYGMPAPPPMHDLTADLERAGQRMVDEVMRERDGSAAKVPVTVLALTGSPGKVLVTQAESADLLVTECTFSDDDADLASQFRHLTAGQAGELAASAGAGTLVLTHFSSRYGDVAPLAEQARGRAGQARVVAANDLDRIAFPQRRAS